ncbi:MAG TPA: hypothetical protein VF493_18420 [Terriglobales bacterium]
MSSTGVLEAVVPERAQSTRVLSKPEVLKSEPAIAVPKSEDHTRTLVISAVILGATMLGAMASTLLIWVWLR